MRALSEHDLIQIWETGMHQHPIDRALTILAAAAPDLGWDELATLSIGQRDACLLEVWQRTFGPGLDGYAECPQCSERLEFTLNAAQLSASALPVTGATTYKWIDDNLAIEFRLPNSRDLAVLVVCEQPERAHQIVVSRCIVDAFQSGKHIAAADLPAAVVSIIAERMTKYDPLAEVLLDLTCPACERLWQAHFDIGAFVWSKLVVTVKRLLREIHTLAWAYGWREVDILAMSPARRQCYLELVS